ncbi:hypothetical protein V6N11_014058 [Hibiscus sabdariffa]|uniref:Uncharacterized protein n=1 Tax=Hibiscus sabdariffa TaxID=183260 RepID=A0ABR2AGH8_9ROSI
MKAELSVTSALETGNDEGEASYNRLHGAIPINKANTKAKDRGKAKKAKDLVQGTKYQARCPVTDADSKHSIDQTPMLGKSLLSFSYLEMEKDFKQVARGTSPTCPFFLNLISRTTS